MPNNSDANRAAITLAFEGLRTGDPDRFIALFHENMAWDVRGSSGWSRSAVGREAVMEQIAGPLFSRLDGPYLNIPEWIIADGDKVVVTARGDATTVEGRSYVNDYCFIFTMAEGKIVAVREYMDGTIADDVLGRHPLG